MNLEPTILDNGLVKMPCLSVSPTSVTAYTRFMDMNGNFKVWNKGIKPECENREKGFISEKGKKAITRAVYWFLYSVDPRIVNTGKGKEKITFLTLTLPSSQMKEHSDKMIKEKLLNHFLTIIRKDYGVNKYIWKAEKQEKGDFHIHLLTDKFLPYYEILKIWNKVSNKLGYVYEYHKRFKDLTYQQYKAIRQKEKRYKGKLSVELEKEIKRAYKKGIATNWMQPNSVDIESLKKVGNVAAYISKYMSKGHKLADKEKLSIDGRIWFSSQAVSKMKNLLLVSADDSTYIEEFTNMLAMYQQTKKVYEGEHAVMLGVPIDQLRYKGFKTIPDEFKNYCDEIFSHSKQQKLFESERVQVTEQKEEIIKPQYEQLNLNL